jgi:hypothetical protein
MQSNMKKSGLVLAIAWTLWIRTQSPTSDTWNAAPGLPSPQRCAASIKEKLDVWRQFKDAVFGENTVTFTTNNTTMSYLCLPEAEDPRKPAAKPNKPHKQHCSALRLGRSSVTLFQNRHSRSH